MQFNADSLWSSLRANIGGTSTSIFAAGLGFGATDTGTGFDTMAGFIVEIEDGACCCILVRRMLSMEKLSFLAG